MEYLLWFDNEKGKPLWTKLREGAEAYRGKHKGLEPNVVVMSDREEPHLITALDMQVRHLPTLQPNNYWFGRETGKEQQTNVG